jgi:hypothetical protein
VAPIPDEVRSPAPAQPFVTQHDLASFRAALLDDLRAMQPVNPTPPQADPRRPMDMGADVDTLVTMSRAMADAWRGTDKPTVQLCPGLSVPLSLAAPWTVFSGVHYLPGYTVRRTTTTGDPVSAWRLDLAQVKTSPEFLVIGDGKQGAGQGNAAFAKEAQATYVRTKEAVFEATLASYAAGPPRRTKDEFFLLFAAGAALAEAMASAKYGWPAGGARVAREFDNAWASGTVDFAKIWPRSSFRHGGQSS